MFAYKDRVQWSEVASALDSLFLNNTGRGLSQEHRNYLVRLLPGQMIDTLVTSWSKISSFSNHIDTSLCHISVD